MMHGLSVLLPKQGTIILYYYHYEYMFIYVFIYRGSRGSLRFKNELARPENKGLEFLIE